MNPILLPPPLQTPPVILLRVECHDPNSMAYNDTFSENGMRARDPNRPVTREAFRDCLSWARVKTPFIPFTNKWRSALKRRRRLLEAGNKGVVIIAVWSKGLPFVYDAYEVAKALERDGGLDSSSHTDEYLVYGGIWADEYRVLAVFGGQNELENVPLEVPGLIGSSTVPAFTTNVSCETARRGLKEMLEQEISSRTGIYGKSEQLLYLKCYMVDAFACPFISFVANPSPKP